MAENRQVSQTHHFVCDRWKTKEISSTTVGRESSTIEESMWQIDRNTEVFSITI